MCLSRIGQIIYGLLALATIGLISAAMFTPGKFKKMNLINNQIIINQRMAQSHVPSQQYNKFASEWQCA
jgi:hypothetical protein